MSNRGEGKLAIIGLAVIIAISGFFIIRHVTPPRPPTADWVCEECDHYFFAPEQLQNRNCPKCPGEAVQTFFFYDTSNEELIEVYRQKFNPSPPPLWLVKIPGGDWQPENPILIATYGVPITIERPADLKPAPPGSEHR